MKQRQRKVNTRSRVFRMVFFPFTVLVLLGLATSIGAAPHVVGSVKLTNLPHATFVSGDKVYVARTVGGIDIVNVKDPKRPRVIGFIDTQDSWVSSVFVAGNFAYVTNDYDGFKVFDVADPKSPVRVGVLGTELSSFLADDASVKGNFAYIAAHTEYGGRTRGLHVVDIEDPTKPSVTGSVETPFGAEKVVVSGGYAFVGGSEKAFFGPGHIWVVAVNDPQKPEIVGNVKTTGWIKDIAVAGHYLYVVDDSGMLQVIDVNDPQNPAVVGSLGDLGYPWSVRVVGSYAYLGDSGGFHTVDISDPEAPRLAHTLKTLNSPEGLSASGKWAYAISYESGTVLKVVDIDDMRNPRLSGSLPIPGYAEDLFVTGNSAYVAAGSQGLQIVDVGKPTQPALVGSVATPGWALDVKVKGPYACLVDDQNVHVVNVSNPSSPTIVNSTPTWGHVDKAFIAGNYTYLIGTGWGLGVADISDPVNPVQVGKVDIKAGSLSNLSLWDLYVSGSNAYVATAAGLFVVDVSTPQAPTIASQYQQSSNITGVSVAGNYAYLDEFGGFSVVNVTDSSNLKSIGSLEHWYRNPYATGGYVYATDSSGLVVIDVHDPAKPVVVGAVEVGLVGTQTALHVSGSFAYVTYMTIPDAKSYLQIVDISDYTIKEKGMVSGTLQADGAPLAGIRAKIYRKVGTKWVCHATKTTNKSGAYLFQDLPQGDYYLDLINIPAASLVAGSIIVEGSPFSSGPVNLYRKTGTTWVKKGGKKPNASGAFQFTGIPAGTYRLKAMNLKLMGKPVL